MVALPTGMLNDASILSLRCLVAVVETQSFSSAARQLRLAPSSVTKHIQTVEKALNVALVHRTTRRISVTDAGGRFYEQCLGILAQIDSAAAIMVAENELSGHLRVTAPPSFATVALGPRIHDFMHAHPAMSIDVIVSSAVPDLIRNRIDVAITLNDEPQSKLSHLHIAECPLILCAAPSYRDRNGLPKIPKDLLRHACLSGRFSELAEGWSLGRDNVWQFVNMPFRLLSDNGELLRQACIGGAGIGSFYRFHVQNDIAEGRLLHVLPDYEPRPRNIYVVTPHRQIVRPQAKAFIDFLSTLIRNDFHAKVVLQSGE